MRARLMVKLIWMRAIFGGHRKHVLSFAEGGNLGVVRAEHGAARVTLPPLATIMLEFEA